MTKALLFSDLHCSLKYLEKMYDFVMQREEIKLLIFAGDVVNMGEPVWVMEKFIEKIQKIGLPFLWVPGNNDFGRAYYKLKAKFNSLEGLVVESLNRRFTGVGGSPASWSGQYQGENSVDKKLIGGTIFVSHFPPPGILTLVQKDLPTPLLYNRHSGLDPESHEILKQVQDDRPSGRRFSDSPLVHICGHLHYRWGTAYLGQTKVIQLASLETGHYAIMDLDNLKVEFGRFK